MFIFVLPFNKRYGAFITPYDILKSNGKELSFFKYFKATTRFYQIVGREGN
jgi:hypothetical protein